MRHSPAVCTVTVCTPSGIPPFRTFRFPLLSSDMTQKKKLQTQAAIAGRTKATSPDLQSTGDSTVGKGVNRLFFADLFLPRHAGYESSSFCWIITVESIGMWFILNQLVFSRVYRYIKFQFCPIFSACLEKNYRVHLLLLKLLLISFLLEVIGHF